MMISGIKHRFLLPALMGALLGTACLAPAGVILADDLPDLPNEFSGEVTVNGAPAPVGAEIIAKIDGVTCGSLVIIEAGEYGGTETSDRRLVVSGNRNDVITFWINGTRASQTAIYEPGKAEDLNLSVTHTYSYPLNANNAWITSALNFLRSSQDNDGSIGGLSTSAWVVMAIAAAGEDPHDWKAGNNSVVDYLETNADKLLDIATDRERSILAIVAAGENPRDFGGINYVDELLEFYDDYKIVTPSLPDNLNDDFWGLIALSAIGESDSVSGCVDYILSNQNSDGGWGLTAEVEDQSDADNTAAAISALIAAGESPDSVVITDALDYLESGVDCWAINAITDVGQNPASSDWRKSGNNPVGHLLSLQIADGSFNRMATMISYPEWMTAYALIALMGKSWPKDTTPPVITSLTPASDASTSDTTPTISAAFTDATSAIDKSSVQMKLDGADVNGATVTASGISYTPGLDEGNHSVSVTVSDKRGNEASQSWSFQVITSDDDDDGGGGGGGGGGGSTPGYTNVTEYVTSTGRFTKEVIAKSEDDKVELDISKDTIGKNRAGQPLRNITITKKKSPPAPPSQSSFIELAYDIGPDGATFEPPISITLSYDPDEIPAGVAEDNLVIVIWNEEDDIWEELPCTVDAAKNTIIASVSHFTYFAILAYTRPASFALSNLSITPAEVNAAERTKVSVLITNNGDLEGTYEVSLELDGTVVRTKEVTLAGDDSDSVSFIITEDAAGEYGVKVGDLTGTFTVNPQLAPAKFSISNLSLSPSEVQIGQSITITALVGNSGKLAGTCKVTLKIDNIAVETKKVKVAGGTSQKVTFVVAKEMAGSYSVAIDGLSGTFTVTEKAPSPAAAQAPPKSATEAPKVAPPPSTMPINWPIIGIVIAAVLVVGLVIFLVFRRSTY
jgi:hypothetical protein